MTNPNKTAAKARASKSLVCVEACNFGSDIAKAEAWVNERRKQGKHVRLYRYRLGPRSRSVLQYHAGVYERAE